MRPWLLIGLLLLTPVTAWAETLRIAAAGSLREVLPRLVASFEAGHAGIEVEARYGASGQLAKQLLHGAPDDLFLSADRHFAELVAEQLPTSSPPTAYAAGRLVLFRPLTSSLPQGIELASLDPQALERIAIAQPDNAPYGRAARAALQASGLWEALQGKLAIAENVAQAAQFAASGNVDGALIAQSQALALATVGDWTAVDLADPTMLVHAMVVTDPTSPAALAFFDFVLAPEAQALFHAHGFGAGG